MVGKNVATAFLCVYLLLSGGAGARSLPLTRLPWRAAAESLQFEPNRGQSDPAACFVARALEYTALLKCDGGAVYALPTANRARADLVQMELEGASAPDAAQGERQLASLVRYYRGASPENGALALPQYENVRFRGVYPGVDLVYQGRQGSLEYEFRIGVGASPDQIRLRFQGARRVWVDEAGDLLLDTPHGVLRHRKPVAFQGGNRRRDVPVRFRLLKGLVGFETGSYDRREPLVIDPTLVFSTFLGGSGFDAARAVATDSSGSVYVTGETASTDFPLPASGISSVRMNRDVFVAKLKADGSSVVYTAILASTGNDAGNAIAVDQMGQVYVTGIAGSGGFPVTAGARAWGGQQDAFVAHLDSAGRMVYCTYLGGNGADVGTGIAIDPSGNAYVSGYTSSHQFPTTTGSPQSSYGGGLYDAFLAKLNPSGTGLLYSTLLGGADIDVAQAVVADTAGNACIAGYTASAGLPVKNSVQNTHRGGGDALVACLNAAGTAWNSLTYLGGRAVDRANGIGMDAAGAVYVTGATSSSDFPSMPGSYQTTKRGDYDAFAVKLSPQGNAIAYSTFVGGGGAEEATAIAVDSSGRAWIAGYTSSMDYPVKNAWQAAQNGSFDGFASLISADGASLLTSSFIGGEGDDRVLGIAIGPSSDLYLAGFTGSTAFPVAGRVVGPTAKAPYDAFVTRLQIGAVPVPVSISPATGSGSTGSFDMVYSDTVGAENIGRAWALFQTAITHAGGCEVYWDRATNGIWLLNDLGTADLGPIAPGSATRIENSQCAVSGSGSTITSSGNTLTLHVALSFKSAFTGAKNVYLKAADASGLDSGWIARGAWTVPGVSATGSLSYSPNPLRVCDGSGLAAVTLTWTTTGTSVVEVHVGSPSGGLLAASVGGSGQAATGKWVTNGMTFYLQNVSGGLPLTPENTLGSVMVSISSSGCGARSGKITASPNTIQACDGSGVGLTTLSWSSAGTSAVEVRVGSPSGGLFAASGPGSASKATGKWASSGMTFFLQDVSGGAPLTSANTLDAVIVTVTNCTGRSGSLTASPDPIQVCDGSGLGSTTLSWSGTGVGSVEVRVGSPSGGLFAASGYAIGQAATGKWVTNGMLFYLQDVTGGRPLTAENTLAAVMATVTNGACSAFLAP